MIERLGITITVDLLEWADFQALQNTAAMAEPADSILLDTIRVECRETVATPDQGVILTPLLETGPAKRGRKGKKPRPAAPPAVPQDVALAVARNRLGFRDIAELKDRRQTPLP